MNEYLYRFTLNTLALGPQLVREPIEWQKLPIKLQRDPERHSIAELFDSAVTFTEIGLSYIQRAEKLGIDTELSFLVEISTDAGVSWETFFLGLLDLSTVSQIEWPTPYKVQISPKRNALWSAFINNLDKSVNLQSPTDIFGNDRVVLRPVTQYLPSQIIRERFNGSLSQSQSFVDDRLTGNKYVTVDFDTNTLDEIDGRIVTGAGVWDTLAAVPVGLNVKYTGQYTFNINFESTLITHALNQVTGVETIGYQDPINYNSGGIVNMSWWIQVDNNPPTQFLATLNVSGANKSQTYSLSLVLNLNPGNQVRVYGIVPKDLHALEDGLHYVNLVFYGTQLINQWEHIAIAFNPITSQWEYLYLYRVDGSQMSVTIPAPPSGSALPSFETILGLTTFRNTSCQGFMTHEAMQSITDRITGMDDSLYAPILGNPKTQRASYTETGCASQRTITQGYQVRNFSLSAKPHAMSFNDGLNGLNPLDNLGVGTKIIDGVEKIYIDTKEAFYDSSGDSLQIFNINNVTRTYDTSLIYDDIELGFSTWKSTTLASIDDPQTSREYAPPTKFIGQAIKVMSVFVGASLQFEFTRRQSVNPSQSWTLDTNNFILEVDQAPDWDVTVRYGNMQVVTFNDVGYICISVNVLGKQPDVYPSLWQPVGPLAVTARLKVNGAFPIVTHLNDPDTRYNKTLTPGRMFLRWRSVFNIGNQQYAPDPATTPIWVHGHFYAKGDVVQDGGLFYRAKFNNMDQPPPIVTTDWAPYGYYVFLTGEGNFDMDCTIVTDSCPGIDVAEVVENANIPITKDVLKGLDQVQFDAPLTWEEYKQIRDHREMSIGISPTDADPVSYYIELIEYVVFSRKATFTLTAKV